jgi:predicted homoserine dehydrogenase-like protein
MIIVDTALKRRQEEGRPVRVAMVGAGFMGRGIANQVQNSVPGMELVAISNRSPEKAERAYREAGVEELAFPSTVAEMEQAITAGRKAVTDDPTLLCRAEGVDAVIEVTGAVEFGAHVSLDAIRHGKHLVLMNAEVYGTVGPILKTYADREGVVISASDGDQPGVEMNLWRFVRSIGLTPVLCGNIKGLQDPYRTPTTQQAFAEKWGQNPSMVTSFADGTKISFEQANVANGTGMTVAKRGMHGFDHDGHVDDATHLWDVDELVRLGGIVDYVVGAKPGPGVFVYAVHDDPKQRHYLNLYKLGEGPLYSFYTPYHLCHFEAPLTAARAVLFGDSALQPLGAPTVEVITRAKRDLKAGEVLDGLGHYMTYGECERADVRLAENLLPLGVAEGCRVTRDLPRDACLTYDDVEVPSGRLVDQLRVEQAERLPVGEAPPARSMA